MGKVGTNITWTGNLALDGLFFKPWARIPLIGASTKLPLVLSHLKSLLKGCEVYRCLLELSERLNPVVSSGCLVPTLAILHHHSLFTGCVLSFYFRAVGAWNMCFRTLCFCDCIWGNSSSLLAMFISRADN